MIFKVLHIIPTSLSKSLATVIIAAIVMVLSHSNIYAVDYYWVGGSGQWSDINHWATTSGGTVFHQQAPTANNTVIFDQNSFVSNGNTVTINLKNAVCKDMIWENPSYTPTLRGADTSSLRIYGSLLLDANMVFDYRQIIYFESVVPGQTIVTAGHTFLCDLEFRGEGGGWVFADELTSERSVTLTHGNLSTGGNNFECNVFSSESEGHRILNLNPSSIVAESWRINGNNLELIADQTQFHIVSQLANENGNSLVYNNLTFTGGTASLLATDVKAVFKTVHFIGGSMNGDFIIDSLFFQANANISGNASIEFASVNGQIASLTGSHVIQKLYCNGKAFIEGEHEIGTVTVSELAEIKGNNMIGTAKLQSKATIIGNNTISHLTITRDAQLLGNNQTTWALLNGNSYIRGSNVFDILNFVPGRTYTLGINSTLTIFDELNASGTCYEPIRIMADTNGVQSTIIKHNGAFTGEFLSIRDLEAQGDIPFVATNAVDLGNNSNWNIETSNGKTIFWVNGSGNWSNPNHWDLVSGGNGGHCPPTEIDHAIFDQQSFSANGQAVVVDIYNAVCKDFNWENAGSAIFSGADTNKLFVYGSLYFNTAMSNHFEGMVYFEAVEDGIQIVSANKAFNNHVWFNGRGGGWLLQDNFRTTQNIFHQQGSLSTLNNMVVCNTYSSTDTTTRQLNIGTSTITLLDNNTDVWELNAQNLMLEASESLLEAFNDGAYIVSFNASDNRLIYNNINFYGRSSSLLNESAYCVFNNVKFYGPMGMVAGDCTIDSLIFYKEFGAVFDSDTINTAIFHGLDGLVHGGEHQIGIAYFYDDAVVQGNNTIDTALFYRNGVINGENVIDTMIVYNRSTIRGENNIRTATLLGEGHFIGTNTFNELTLTKANTYFFQHGKTQTVIDELNINGSCTGFISLQSDVNGSRANIHKSNGTVEGEYILIRDMQASGPQLPFIVYDAVDLGNNEGWEVHSGEPKELFWVNGSGNWSDSLHWAVYSGGEGGYCIPTPIDNVYFDENAFNSPADSVTIDLANATCHNMNWHGATGNPSLKGADSVNLKVYGSMRLAPNLVNNFSGKVLFEATNEGKTIETKEIVFNDTVIFQGIGGGWTLLDNFHSLGPVYFKHGALALNQNELIAKSFNSDFIYPRKLDISYSTVNLFGINLNAFHLRNNNLQFISEQSTIISTGINGLIRTEGGGTINYNQILLSGLSSRVYNMNTHAQYNKIQFDFDGHVFGNCTIDSLLIAGSGSINGSDSIHYMQVSGNLGEVKGGSHRINTLILTANGLITGQNQIDTAIIHGNGTIEGSNFINKTLIIGKTADISGQNVFEDVVLKGNGTIADTNTFKSLKLTPGNIYEFEENTTQYISHQLYARGNNCFPITIRSKNQGIQARIELPAARVVSGDFIELRDMHAGGGATFYAGDFGVDISNNTGWIFANAPGYVYGFPADTIICYADNTYIDTENFNPDENSTFMWHDGSTLNRYLVKPSDTLAWVQVNYADACFHSDTIAINLLPSPFIDLGEDIEICRFDTLFPLNHTENVRFQWHDGSENPYFITDYSGIYSLLVTNDYGCTYSDDIAVEILPVPQVDLGEDITIGANDYTILDAGNFGSAYLWSTGETTQTIQAGSNQTYWVEVSKDGCSASDTIAIGEFPPCIIAIPNAFSPNGDGRNDVLYVRGEGFDEFELMVFNRWGEMLFRSINLSHGWDGNYNGRPVPVDAYNYYLRGICVDGQTVEKKGTITLLR